MEEEEEKDDKKDKVERQHNAAEESKQGEVSGSRIQAETSKNIDNKGVQGQGSQVFQMSSETKELETQAQNENGMSGIKESITQKKDGAGESSLSTGADHQELLSLTEGADLEEKHGINTVVETLAGARIVNKGFFSDEEPIYQNFPIVNKGFSSDEESIYQNFPVQLQQSQEPEKSLLLTEKSGSQSLARETTEHQEKDKRGVRKSELKQSGSPKRQLKQATSGDITEKQTHASESKQGERPGQLGKGQKAVQGLKQTGKESQQKEGKEKGKKLDSQSTSEANKMQQKKVGSEQRKSQSDQKFKTEEKQIVQAKDGKKQPLFQKEPRLMPKPAEIRKTDKKEHKLPTGQKELQNFPSKKPLVHRKEPLPSPKKNAPSQALTKQKQSNLKKVQQKAGNANVIKNNESKGNSQQQSTEDSSLVAKNQQKPSLPQSTMTPPSMELQETPGKGMSKENKRPLPKLEKELFKENKKQEEVQTQGTNKLTEKKSQQEKKNEIKKQKQQNEANQQLKQLKKENQQSPEHVNKIPHKSGQNIKATMPQKKEESLTPLASRKQASKANKDLRETDISTQRNRETNATQQQQMNKNSSKQQCLKEGKEAGKPSRNSQSATINKNSIKENSNEDVIHSIRRQYQQRCKEEAMKQQLLDQLPHSRQPAQKEEKVQQQKPEVNNEENKIGRKENLNQLAKKKSEDYEDDKGLGCGGMQGSSCPIYFGVRSYLHHFYDTPPVKNPQLYEEYTEEDDFEYAVDPVKPRGCRKCCQGFWFRAGLWGGINLILVGVITFLVGYLTPQREIVVGQQGDLEILDRSAIIFNHRLELCRLAGLAVFCCGGMVLFVVLFISTLLHVKGHNNESTCCAANIYYHGYATAPIVEPFIVAQDLSVPSTTGIKIPIIEEIKSVQPTIWPEMGTVRDGSRVGQMP